MAGTNYYIRRLTMTDVGPYVSVAYVEGGWWGVFTQVTSVLAKVYPTAGEGHQWIRMMGGVLVNAPVAPAPEPVPAPAPKPVAEREYVSCDRCSARAIVTLETHGGGLLSFCGHHNRAVQERYDVFRSARGATNDVSDAALAAIVDDLLDDVLGHHLVVAR